MAMISMVEPRERIHFERNFEILKFTRTQTQKKKYSRWLMLQRVFSNHKHWSILFIRH